MDGGKSKIGWRERGGWGKGFGDFELAGDLELIRISRSLLFELLLSFFKVIRSTSSCTGFFGFLILSISGSRDISIMINFVVVVDVDVVVVVVIIISIA